MRVGELDLPRYRKAFLFLFILFLVFALAWFTWLPQEALRVSFLDIGQGDAIFIQSASGAQMLVDAGPNSAQIISELSREMGPIDRTIDLVLATHGDADHIGGFDRIFRRFSIGAFIESSLPSESKLFGDLSRQVDASGVKRIYVREGSVINLDPETKIVVLSPSLIPSGTETNDASIVLVLSYAGRSFLLNGDAPVSVERDLVARYPELIDVDVLKAGHHGSRTSTSEDFLRATSPASVVISAGAGNRYGHPHAEVIDLLEKSGVSIRQTAREGPVVFTVSKEGEIFSGEWQ